MQTPQHIRVEHYKDQQLEFKMQSLSRCIFNPFEKTHELRSRIAFARYSVDAIGKCPLYERNDIRRSQRHLNRAIDLHAVQSFAGSSPKDTQSQILAPMSPENILHPSAVTEMDIMPEGVRKRNRELLKTESKLQGSRAYLPSPYKIPPTSDSFQMSFRNANFLTQRLKPLQSVSSFQYLQDPLSGPRIDWSQFPRRVMYNGQVYEQVRKPSPRLKEFCVVNFGGLALQLLHLVFVTLMLMVVFNFVFLCRSIKQRVFDFYWTNSLANIRSLLSKALWGSVNWQNLGLVFVLGVLAALQRYFQRQKEYVEEAMIVYLDLEALLIQNKVEDKTFFDENFCKKAFYHRPKISRIRRYLNHMINADGRIRVLRSRSNLEIFVFSL